VELKTRDKEARRGHVQATLFPSAAMKPGALRPLNRAQLEYSTLQAVTEEDTVFLLSNAANYAASALVYAQGAAPPDVGPRLRNTLVAGWRSWPGASVTEGEKT
jgi:hypothetical protein